VALLFNQRVRNVDVSSTELRGARGLKPALILGVSETRTKTAIHHENKPGGAERQKGEEVCENTEDREMQRLS